MTDENFFNTPEDLTTNRTELLREDAKRIFAMNTRWDALDMLRAQMRSAREDDKTDLYYSKLLQQRLDRITGEDVAENVLEEAARKRHQDGIRAIDSAPTEELKGIIAKQRDVLRERMKRDNLDYDTLDRGTTEALSEKAFERLMTIESLLVQREMFEGISRDALLKDAEFREEITINTEKMLRTIDAKLEENRIKPALEEPPLLIPQEPMLDENGQKLVPMPRDPGQAAQPERAPVDSRKIEDLRKKLGPKLREGDDMNPRKQIDPNAPKPNPKVAGMLNIDQVVAMSDMAIRQLTGNEPKPVESTQTNAGLPRTALKLYRG